MKFSIRTKLILAFTIILLMLAGTAITTVVNLNLVYEDAEQIDQEVLPSIVMLADLRTDVMELNRLVLRIRLEKVPSEIDRLNTKLTDHIAELDKHMKDYSTMLEDEQEQELFQSMNASFLTYKQQIPRLLDNSIRDQEWLELNTEAQKVFIKASDTSLELVNLHVEEGNQATDQSVQVVKESRTLIIILSVIAYLIGIGITSYMARNMSKPIRRLTAQVQRVAEGDLTVEDLKIKSRDEVGELSGHFTKMTGNLRALLRQVALNSEQVAATSEELTASADQTTIVAEQISQSVQDVSFGAEKQLQGIQDSTQVVADISESVGQIAQSIQGVTDSSLRATGKATDGQNVVNRTVSQMEVIGDRVNSTADVINDLGKKSEEIGAIVGLITSIAGQTNLLALNAAIEAARAGEHGKGFAVVADEVRKLAEQSGEAADHIRRLITEVQADTGRAIASMEEGTRAVEDGVRLIGDTGAAFREILASVSTLSDQAQEVAAAVQQVSAGTQTMVSAMEGIAAVSEQAAANTQQVAASVEEQNASMEEIASAATLLSKMASELQDGISTFKL
ncbi:hypothetical protein CBW65_11785 [Tumebacillus avium]|uniref:Methyl-accepting chemotaxis protein n=1 Tax=Tumebacillus avium TaxID=1903704 RepID=A0A1Y0IM86_9BACL|nr:methyl-accepting chemotaxis protein [Tumebacillus avium]ARU61617.1 hypothetical protein CBW65_11785 [Tumebacillus avium]